MPLSIKKLRLPLYCLLLIISTYTSCKKGGSDTSQPQKPIPLNIKSLSITEGGYNTVVSINGTGFSEDPTRNRISFNGQTVTAIFTSTTRLDVRVPFAAGTGNVNVYTNGSTAIGPSFKYLQTLTVITLAGDGSPGAKDGAGTEASFLEPTGMVLDAAGNIYVADAQNNKIRKITSYGLVSTFAGTGAPGASNGSRLAATFSGPRGLAIDAMGNMYVADTNNQLIRKISPDGQVTTFAGDGSNQANNGPGTSASFNNPWDVATDSKGNVYVADLQNSLIRIINPNGEVSTFAGSGSAASTDGTGKFASFNQPAGIDIDKVDQLYVVERPSNMVRKIGSFGEVTTIAGGHSGPTNGVGSEAGFKDPQGITVGKNGLIYVADTADKLIRKIADRTVTTFAGAEGVLPTDGAAAQAGFTYPIGIVTDAAGFVYVADAGRRQILRVGIQ